ncbi:MAG TPA: sugar phosphate isomerase/epimerase [Longimicrobiales bacterium]
MLERSDVSRRDFLRLLAGTAAAPSALAAALGVHPAEAARRTATSPGASPPHAARAVHADRLGAIGIQLYTVRDLMARDVEGTLAALARIGYREVEFAGLHGRSAREMRAILDRLELTAPAGHVSLAEVRDDLDRVLDDAATLGQDYVVCPYLDVAYRSRDGIKRAAEIFNRAGAAARGVGLGFAYHNHDFEFEPLPDGTLPYDLLLAETDPALVRMEMDLFWITKGGGDPLAYFARHAGRFPLVHVKDLSADGAMVNVGEGTIDFAKIFARAEQAGIRHYFVEHDQPAAPLDDARVSYTYLRRLEF